MGAKFLSILVPSMALVLLVLLVLPTSSIPMILTNTLQIIPTTLTITTILRNITLHIAPTSFTLGIISTICMHRMLTASAILTTIALHTTYMAPMMTATLVMYTALMLLMGLMILTARLPKSIQDGIA